jgi:PAS domain S-box-containing protein
VSRARYFDLYNLAPAGYCTVNKQGLILETNLTATILAGAARGAMVNQPVSRFILNEDHGIFHRHHKQLFETDDAQEFELRMVKKDGAIFWAQMSSAAARSADGDPVAHVVFGDITERKQAAAALVKTQAHYRNLLETASDGIHVLNLNGDLLEASDSFYRMLGYSPQDPLPTHISNFDAQWTAEELTVRIASLIESESVFETRHRCRDGQMIVVEINARGIEIDGQRYLYASARDITERKRMQAAAKKLEAQNRLLQKSESLGRMAGAIAHHFNNQLQAVTMGLEMAIKELPRNSEPAAILTIALQSAAKAAEVSGLMLTYLGQKIAKIEPLDLSDVCHRSLPMLRASFPKDVVLASDLLLPGPVVNGNASQIQQVLASLVTNAWEASRDGRSAIRLNVKMVSAADIPEANRFPIDWQVQDAFYACIEVADSGCGIAPKDVETLFDPFYSSKFTGRGLGLAVVLGIVRAHSGGVTVDSQPGRGSVFRVYFPATAEASPVKPVLDAQVPKTSGVGTVLVVDDETNVRETFKTVLEVMGFTVLAAKDGVEAVEVFGRHRDEIHLVLCDLCMPRMDGWQTLSALRALSPAIPVILCSGYSEAQAMAGEHPERPQAFLSKPFRFEEFRQTIFRVLTNEASRRHPG